MGGQVDVHAFPEVAVVEEEESLSFCDLHGRNDESPVPSASECIRQPSSEAPPELFQFFCDANSEMCSAEDVMFCGKLVPFKQNPLSVPTPKSIIREEKKHANGFRRRSESLPEIKNSLTRSDSIRNTLMRSSTSLDCSSLSRLSSSLEIDRNSSVKSVGKYDFPVKRLARPSWSVMMFGMAKFPVEMELNDIKNRQSRINSPPFLPPVDGGKHFPVNRRASGKGATWRLLKALSCKDDTSVPATAPFCMPRVGKWVKRNIGSCLDASRKPGSFYFTWKGRLSSVW